ncbi:spherulation-specific family protein [Hirsutella rhossiliensis]|uniref:Spherulation-specific family protein n=1 Tax=Hirsutella rhossiliensis TaxID=111463 RepID=A0A9P8N473_9HYPO|nr:spherulation-specific family protein [Hirsutella rhossiliensis]KAH0965519.1 spherulation-specific family protein [Hirsutella rhossiliensis]
MKTPFVLIPLYIYPLERAWEPLLEAARAHREVHFVAIINPDNGPGRGRLPDGSYTAALSRLAEEPNISTLGYVYCSYGQRAVEAIQADMDIYRGWCRQGQLAVGGVFFDETPSDPAYVEYMATLAHYAKETWRRDMGDGEGHGGREATVVYNPGVVVGPGFFFRGADYVVVFEASEDQWNRLRKLGQDLRRMDDRTRPKAVAIIHSSRGGSSGSGARKVLKQTRSLGLTGVYVTDQQEGGYTRWPAAWMKFAKAVSQC